MGWANVVGGNETAGGFQAFLYSGGSMHNLGKFWGERVSPSPCNNNGQIGGFADTSDGVPHAFLHSGNGSLVLATDNLGMLPAPYNYSSQVWASTTLGRSWENLIQLACRSCLYGLGGVMEDLTT